MTVNVSIRPISYMYDKLNENECKCIEETNFYMHRKLNKNECKCIKQTNFQMHRKTPKSALTNSALEYLEKLTLKTTTTTTTRTTLTHLLPIHHFSTPWKHPKTWRLNLTVFWCFKVVEKGCIGKEWVKRVTSQKLGRIQSENVYIIYGSGLHPLQFPGPLRAVRKTQRVSNFDCI